MFQDGTATQVLTTTEPRPLTSDEDVLRRYHPGWRDTAFGRAEHYRRCPKSSHRRCGGAR